MWFVTPCFPYSCDIINFWLGADPQFLVFVLQTACIDIHTLEVVSPEEYLSLLESGTRWFLTSIQVGLGFNIQPKTILWTSKVKLKICLSRECGKKQPLHAGVWQGKGEENSGSQPHEFCFQDEAKTELVVHSILSNIKQTYPALCCCWRSRVFHIILRL